VRKAGFHGAKVVAHACCIVLLFAVFIGATSAVLVIVSHDANAACLVTTSGTVNCNADTTTTPTTNIDGGITSSSARTQRFHNGSTISGSIQSGVAVGGFGLKLIEKPGAKNFQAPITMNNQGQVTTGNGVSSLQLSGDGDSVSYFGDGSIANTGSKAALLVENVRGNISIATGLGAIVGATGISAGTTGDGALAITTGSGLVSGTAGQGILASTASGKLSVTVGTGGVFSTDSGRAVHGADAGEAINASSVNGDISITSDGPVVGATKGNKDTSTPPAIKVTSDGWGSILIDTSGPVIAPAGRAIWASELASGLGGILVMGTGQTMGLGAQCPVEGSAALSRAARSGKIGCSAIRAEILNEADASDIVVDRSGSVVGTSTGINAITAGNGNIFVNTRANTQIRGIFEFGIEADSLGAGSESISTNAGTSVTTGGTGILVRNLAGAISPGADSTIAVTTEGAITSSATPVDGIVNPKNPTGVLAGILAAYVGGEAATPNPKVNGTVNVVNGAAINMAGGDGIVALNFGNGNVSVTSSAPIFAAQNGIEAISDERGDISITNTANVTGGDGNGIQTTNRRGGTTTINALAGTIGGATGINANATGTGAVAITTGSGLVSGTAGPGIVATTVNGAINVTVGSGGVTSRASDNSAIALTSTNGNIVVNASGSVAGYGSTAVGSDRINFVGGVHAISDGEGNISIGGSGTFFGQYGRPIWAEESTTGLGGILVTGSGATIEGSPVIGCCSAIRAEIENPADSSNIVVERSGDVMATSTLNPPEAKVSAGIHAITAGGGNIIIAGGSGATISNTGLYGIDAEAFGAASSGSISVSTGMLSALTAGGGGILAANSAFAIPVSAGSAITVTNNGTIESGVLPNPVGRFLTGGGAVSSVPAGILAGYDGGPLFGSASGRYTSCGFFGCTTLTPNPHVNGTVDVVNNGVINAAGGDGIFAFNFGNGNVSVTSNAPVTAAGATSRNGIEVFGAEAGNIGVTTTANVTASEGNGIQTTSRGGGTTTINAIAGTIQGATGGVSATSSHGTIEINNTATIENLSGQLGGLAVVTSGGGNASLTNKAAGIVTGSVVMTDAGSNCFTNAGLWNTAGTSRFVDANISNSGVINVFDPTTFGGLTTLTNSGTLNLAADRAAGTLTVPGSLAFRSGALYVVALTPTNSSLINVGGTALLAGAVEGVLLPGSYSRETYTILHSQSLDRTKFSGFINPGFTGMLSYTSADVLLSLTASLGVEGGLNVNQQNVATALNNFFNNGGVLPANFLPVFGLSGGSLANALTQLHGEVAAEGELAAIQLMDEFLNLMLDPFVDGRLGGSSGGGKAMGFAADEQASLPPDVALAYATILKAPPAPPFAQRWTAWGASYGGANATNGDPGVGASNLAAQTFGFAGGMDYHYSPDTMFGFALGGGGTDWGLATGGTGRSDAFQTGVYGVTRSGPAYLAGGLAFANHWMTTNRSALGDALTANFAAQSYGGRIETGYRFAVLPMLGVTPYAAVQAQDFHMPSYSEADLTGGGFGLSYAGMNATDTRTELGARFDDPTVIGGLPLLLRGRLAWAHDFVSNPALGAVFQTLPGTNFVVNGAAIPHDSALTSAGAELYITPRFTLLAKFDGEFAVGSQTYAGSATLRYSW
jgi:uncharacterized protein with beta-barrel porin domain